MSDRSAALYSLDKARASSLRLEEARNVTEVRRRPNRRPFTPFSMANVATEWRRARRGAPVETVELPPAPERGFRTMGDLMHWCRDASGATVCFVVDSQGFVLDYEGRAPYQEMEDYGSQLTVILSRADETESAGRSRRVELAYDSLHLTGVRVAIEDESWLTVIIVTERQIPPPRATAIIEVLEEHVPRL